MESVSMKNVKNVEKIVGKDSGSQQSKNGNAKLGKEELAKIHQKMSDAAKKAWDTIRANRKAAGIVSGNGKKLAKALSKAVSKAEDSGEFKADDKKEMAVINGVDLAKMAHETQKKLDRRDKIETAKKGMQEKKALTVGKIIKKARVERSSGGVAFIRA
jgi:hypothetical protein